MMLEPTHILMSAFSRASPRARSRAFSLIELVIVVVIIGTVAAIAIPRMSSASQSALDNAMSANLRVMDGAVELYVAEHENRSPAEETDGSTTSDPTLFMRRLTGRTDVSGTVGQAPFGPYLRQFPVNTRNGLSSVRIDGGPAGMNVAGWRFNTTRRRFLPDDSAGAVVVFDALSPSDKLLESVTDADGTVSSPKTLASASAPAGGALGTGNLQPGGAQQAVTAAD